MKLYIAGSSKELDRAAAWIERAKLAGLTITFDWTVPIREKGSGNALPFLEKRGYAAVDMRAIREADIFWFLAPIDHITFGGVWEFGFACGMDHAHARVREPDPSGVVVHPMLLVLSGPKKDAHIFTTLADAHFENDEDAFEYILRHQVA